MHRSAKTSLVACACLIAFTAPATAAAPEEIWAAARTVTLSDRSGKQVGQAKLAETRNGVLIRLVLSGVPEGAHAFHIHEAGECRPPFESAGGHFNPAGSGHGFLDERKAHLGDLPNIHVPGSSTLTLEALATGVTLQQGVNSLSDENGSALVIHAKPDDYRSDPAGDAGDRIACGVIAGPRPPAADRD